MPHDAAVLAHVIKRICCSDRDRSPCWLGNVLLTSRIDVFLRSRNDRHCALDADVTASASLKAAGTLVDG